MKQKQLRLQWKEEGLLNLDMDAYTPKEWKRHIKVRNARYAYESVIREE